MHTFLDHSVVMSSQLYKNENVQMNVCIMIIVEAVDVFNYKKPISYNVDKLKSHLTMWMILHVDSEAIRAA